jgi:hypothetical protein
MVKDYEKLLRISQVLNSSFGTDGPGGQAINGINVKLDPIDDKLLKGRAIMNVSFRSDQMMRELLRKYREEAVAMLKGAMDRAVEDYNNRFEDNIKLSMDDMSLDESTEFYHVSQYSAQSRAFYRVNVLIHVK